MSSMSVNPRRAKDRRLLNPVFIVFVRLQDRLMGEQFDSMVPACESLGSGILQFLLLTTNRSPLASVKGYVTAPLENLATRKLNTRGGEL